MFLVEVIGYSAMACCIVAYLLNVFKLIASDSGWYLGLNFFGAVLFILYYVHFGASAGIIFNMFWMIIALVKIVAQGLPKQS